MQIKPLIDTRTMQLIQPTHYRLYDYFTGWRLACAIVAAGLVVLGVAL